MSVAVALGGCSYPFDDYLPQKTDAGLSTNADARPQPIEDTDVGEDTTPRDSGTFEIDADDTAPGADTLVGEDTNPPEDAACACVRYTGSKCKEWSPPGCGD